MEDQKKIFNAPLVFVFLSQPSRCPLENDGLRCTGAWLEAKKERSGGIYMPASRGPLRSQGPGPSAS